MVPLVLAFVCESPELDRLDLRFSELADFFVGEFAVYLSVVGVRGTRGHRVHERLTWEPNRLVYWKEGWPVEAIHVYCTR